MPDYPSANQLAELIADFTEYPRQDGLAPPGLAEASSYACAIIGRPSLRSKIRDVFWDSNANKPRCAPKPVHDLLASLEVPQIIIATNYDDLLEQAFKAVNRPYDLIIYPADSRPFKDSENSVFWQPNGESGDYCLASNIVPDFEKTLIVKMHGSLRSSAKEDAFLISEEDYLEFLIKLRGNAAIPSTVLAQMKRKSFLFLGYSIRDWNFRLILNTLSEYRRYELHRDERDYPIASWAVQTNPRAAERVLWDRRYISIFDEDVQEFACKIRHS